jgi:hypothetical protein
VPVRVDLTRKSGFQEPLLLDCCPCVPPLLPRRQWHQRWRRPDSGWSCLLVCCGSNQAGQAGKDMAEMLLSRSQGARPVTLIAYGPSLVPIDRNARRRIRPFRPDYDLDPFAGTLSAPVWCSLVCSKCTRGTRYGPVGKRHAPFRSSPLCAAPPVLCSLLLWLCSRRSSLPAPAQPGVVRPRHVTASVGAGVAQRGGDGLAIEQHRVRACMYNEERPSARARLRGAFSYSPARLWAATIPTPSNPRSKPCCPKTTIDIDVALCSVHCAVCPVCRIACTEFCRVRETSQFHMGARACRLQVLVPTRSRRTCLFCSNSATDYDVRKSRRRSQPNAIRLVPIAS